MLKAYAANYVAFAEILSEMTALLEDAPGKPFPEKKIERLQKEMGAISRDLHLPMMTAQIDRFASLAEEGANGPALVSAHKEIRARMRDELAAHQFFYVPTERVHFYQPDFGSKVSEKFSSALPDIDEAGKCIALGRAPAAVFHLMRVVEVALRSLREPLAISDPIPGWNTIIRKLDSEIKKEPKERTLRTDYAVLESASNQMHAVNRAWRRRAMHVDMTFNLETAIGIFDATKSLMQFLAEHFSEPSVSGEKPDGQPS